MSEFLLDTARSLFASDRPFVGDSNASGLDGKPRGIVLSPTGNTKTTEVDVMRKCEEPVEEETPPEEVRNCSCGGLCLVSHEVKFFLRNQLFRSRRVVETDSREAVPLMCNSQTQILCLPLSQQLHEINIRQVNLGCKYKTNQSMKDWASFVPDVGDVSILRIFARSSLTDWVGIRFALIHGSPLSLFARLIIQML